MAVGPGPRHRESADEATDDQGQGRGEPDAQGWVDRVAGGVDGLPRRYESRDAAMFVVQAHAGSSFICSTAVNLDMALRQS